jgi:hypothetical protein
MKDLTGKIQDAVYQNIQRKGFVAPVDVLMDIGVLEKKDYDAWRRGQVPYLEKVCRVNLHKLSAIMRALRTCAAKNMLKLLGHITTSTEKTGRPNCAFQNPAQRRSKPLMPRTI